MEVSRDLVLFTARREALVLTAYPDGPHLSAGFGHNDKSLKNGDRVTAKQAFQWLREDLRHWEGVVNKGLKVLVKQQQFDALVDLAYNTGNRYIHTVIEEINHQASLTKEYGEQTDKDKDLHELWIGCNRNLAGEVKPGLTMRRELEWVLYATGDYGPQTPIPYWEGNPHTTKRKEYTPTEEDLSW